MQPDESKPRDPEQLEYHTPALSPYDRPVDGVVRTAERMNRVRRIFRLWKWIIVLPAILALLWYIHSRMPEMQRAMGR